MSEFFAYLTHAVAIGAGATFLMDVWGLIAARLFGFPQADYGSVGRWIGHMSNGRFFHDRIVRSPPISGERILGWAAHYLVGILFAGVLLIAAGGDWLRQPTLAPALAVGILTVTAPFLLMQPGMGAGIASARTPNPTMARVRSLLTHTIFGFGLYGAGRLMTAIA